MQVAMYKYIVNVEGNCAALRLKQLLAGPSAVFFVQSDEIEWFYPLLKPFVHYVPVSFSWAGVIQCLIVLQYSCSHVVRSDSSIYTDLELLLMHCTAPNFHCPSSMVCWLCSCLA